MCIVGAYLAEFLEDPCLVFRSDADTGVTDRYLYRTICLPGFNSDPSSVWRELYCVGKQIEKNLFDLPLIADEFAKTLVNCNIEIDAVLGGPLAHKRAGVVDGQGQIERCQLKLHPPSLDFVMTSDLVEQIQKLAREQHEGDFGKAARAYFRDHPSEWAAYRDESSVHVAKQAEDPGGIAAEVHYAIEHIAYRDHLYLEKGG